MTAILEQKYIHLLSSRLDRFRNKDTDLFNFRCPLCSDSKKNKNKARGYIYLKDGSYVFHCHNCNKTCMFYTLLKTIATDLYDRYILEKFSKTDNKKDDLFQTKKIVISTNEPLKVLKKISNLDHKHPAKKYVVSRMIPTPYHAELFWCPKFKEWTNSIIPDKFDLSVGKDEGRLIIPLLDQNNVMFGFQGRSLKPDTQLRYISIMMNEDKPKIFGMHKVNTNIRFYVVEGPIDSMFIPNTIAACGGNLITELSNLQGNKDNATIVYDNQPRNKEIVENMLTAINKGFKVCVWPLGEKSKDINEMIIRRVPETDFVRTEQVQNASIMIKKIIDANTYSGLTAKLKISEWRKN